MRRGGLLATHVGSKRGTIGNALWEHIGNLGNMVGTHWELEGNLMSKSISFVKTDPIGEGFENPGKEHRCFSLAGQNLLSHVDYYFLIGCSPILDHRWAFSHKLRIHSIMVHGMHAMG